MFDVTFVPRMANVPSFVSDIDTSHNDSTIEQPTRKPKRKIVWSLVKEFTNKNDALSHMKAEGKWGKNFSNDSREGLKVTYRCAKVKRRAKQCNAAMQLYYPSDTDTVHLRQSDQTHTCEEFNNDKRLTAEGKAEIKRLLEAGKKPFQIWNEFGRLSLSNKRQMYNCISGLKKAENPIVNISDLEEWCKNYQDIPAESNCPFVAASEFDAENQIARLFVTTVNLLTQTAKGDRLHADGTYKNIWEGFPVLVVGTTDAKRRFILGGLAVCTGETTEDYLFLFRALQNAFHKLSITYLFR